MKNLQLQAIFFLFNSFLTAGNWNPYVKNGTVSPGILLPWQLEGKGVISFTVGNSGIDSVYVIEGQEMKLVLTLSNGEPDVPVLNDTSALTVIGGNWASYFTWSYNHLTNSYTGIQKQVIDAQSEGSVTVQYKVKVNSSEGAPANGFNVNLTPPPYTNGVNSTNDDAESIYTYTMAGDFGDAPSGYGTANHVIDIDFMTNSVFLGETVDYEPVDQASPFADKDDSTGIDDEDGIVFPVLKLDASVTIPVMVTTNNEEQGFISGWIDWDGNGLFSDGVEKIAGDVPVQGTGTIYLTGIGVPNFSVTTVPTFARFRVGPEKMGSTGTYSFGETEDYKVQIINPYIGIEEKEESSCLAIYSIENVIVIKNLSGRELHGEMRVFNLVGQQVARNFLTGGTLNKFKVNIDQGYYLVEVVNDEGTYHGEVFLSQ